MTVYKLVPAGYRGYYHIVAEYRTYLFNSELVPWLRATYYPTLMVLWSPNFRIDGAPEDMTTRTGTTPIWVSGRPTLVTGRLAGFLDSQFMATLRCPSH